MCLGVPGRVLEVSDERALPMATVDFGGATKEVCLAYVPGAREGDHVIVHAGFAIAQLDEESAAESIAMFAAMTEAPAGTAAPEPPTGAGR